MHSTSLTTQNLNVLQRSLSSIEFSKDQIIQRFIISNQTNPSNPNQKTRSQIHQRADDQELGRIGTRLRSAQSLIVDYPSQRSDSIPLEPRVNSIKKSLPQVEATENLNQLVTRGCSTSIDRGRLWPSETKSKTERLTKAVRKRVPSAHSSQKSYPTLIERKNCEFSSIVGAQPGVMLTHSNSQTNEVIKSRPRRRKKSRINDESANLDGPSASHKTQRPSRKTTALFSSIEHLPKTLSHPSNGPKGRLTV